MELRPAADKTQFNPLAKHFRQPSIFLKLPSKGQHWATNSLNLPVNGELGILPMTTKDEILLKTPDALINGQGVVSVIESCCPDIKDAWKMPSIDVDAVLIGIRIASYGNKMDFTAECIHCKTESDYALDLSATLDTISAPNYDEPLPIGNLLFKFKPQAYSSANKTNMIAFEEQQLLRSLTTFADNPTAANEQFQLHLNKILELNTELLSHSIEKIITEDGTEVTKLEYITEYLRNCDNQIIKTIQNKLKEFGATAGIKPINVNCNNEQCQKEFPISITFDYASFFDSGS